MHWLSRAAPKGGAPNQRGVFRQPVDVAVALEVSGMRMAANATVVNLSITGCRLRAWIVLERGARISFLWPGATQELRLRGRVIVRASSKRGAAFEYGIVFEQLTPQEADVLGRIIAEAQRRNALQRAETARTGGGTVDATLLNRRNSYRARADFGITLRFDERPGLVDAKATDVSSGGLRAVTEQPLTEGDLVTVRFRLPNDVLSVYPPGTLEEVVITPFGPRTRRRQQRRPFEEMSIRSRVASRLKDWHDRPAFGISFVEIDAYTREEILRFIHAAQLQKLRERKAR